MENNLPYNEADPIAIEAYAKRLLNKSLRHYMGEIKHVDKNVGGKGKLGQILEGYFGKKLDNKSQPDFMKAGVELKSTPLKKITKGLVSKERLVFNIIDYMEEHKHDFEHSSFWRKNSLMLLMFYLYESKEQSALDCIFKIIRLWSFPEKDLKIIKDDWQKIVDKIKQGKAHEISEGDTLYLGACRKGANNQEPLRSQPFNPSIKARQRAFSLKQTYLNNVIIKQSLPDSEPIIKDIKEYKSGLSFEDLVIKRFEKYYNKSDVELIRELKINDTDAKNKFSLIAKAITRAILGISKGNIEEFSKADVELKTIRLEKTGQLKESMSFHQIDYNEIIMERWEDSYWHSTLTKRFFFVIFKKDAKNVIRLSKVMFWTMPYDDLKMAKKFWLDTKNKIAYGDYNNFIKISDGLICHVRPKAIDSLDKMKSPQGTMEKKKAYWLNREYILQQIQPV